MVIVSRSLDRLKHQIRPFKNFFNKSPTRAEEEQIRLPAVSDTLPEIAEGDASRMEPSSGRHESGRSAESLLQVRQDIVKG